MNKSGLMIRQARGLRLMSQGEVAGAIGVARTWVSGLENAAPTVRPPDRETCQKLAAVLHLDPDKLYHASLDDQLDALDEDLQAAAARRWGSDDLPPDVLALAAQIQKSHDPELIKDGLRMALDEFGAEAIHLLYIIGVISERFGSAVAGSVLTTLVFTANTYLWVAVRTNLDGRAAALGLGTPPPATPPTPTSHEPAQTLVEPPPVAEAEIDDT